LAVSNGWVKLHVATATPALFSLTSASDGSNGHPAINKKPAVTK
jgi:hypothetical protein